MRPLRHDRFLSRGPHIELVVSQVDVASRIVHLWWLDLDELARSRKLLTEHLSPDERLRAERSSGGVTGSRFALGRGGLREIVGLYCGVQPVHVEFVYGPSGKPGLVGVSGADLPTFNVSYAGRLMVIAVGTGGELGIDVELLTRHADITPIADAVFSQGELNMLATMPTRKREKAMVRGWTGKEAILKADGRGLVTHLATINVLNGADYSGLRAAWQLHAVPVPVSGYVASLAVPAHPTPLKEERDERGQTTWIA